MKKDSNPPWVKSGIWPKLWRKNGHGIIDVG